MNIASTGSGNASDDSLAIEHLFQSYFSRLCYFAYRLIGNKEAAQDIVQDSFIKYWDRRRDFSNEPSVKSFLFNAD